MCGCNMMDDGIDMDVLRSLPGKFIKKIAYHSNVPMDSYNDALKQAIKARAKSSSTNVRQFLTGIPGVEAEIIKIEKMKEGGNLYAPYSKKAQGPFGPKYVDSKTLLSVYAEQQDKKTKEQYRTDMLRPMMQGGGSNKTSNLIKEKGITIHPSDVSKYKEYKSKGYEFLPMVWNDGSPGLTVRKKGETNPEEDRDVLFDANSKRHTYTTYIPKAYPKDPLKTLLPVNSLYKDILSESYDTAQKNQDFFNPKDKLQEYTLLTPEVLAKVKKERESENVKKQQGGSILNDIGKEHMIIPRNQGTELNIPKYIQAYVQATTNMGKYQEGGSFKEKFEKFGGMGAVAGIAGQLADITKPPVKEVDPNAPPLKRFDKGGVSETMNFYIQHYPGYKEGIKRGFQDGGKVIVDGVTLTDEQAKIYNDLQKTTKTKLSVKIGDGVGRESNDIDYDVNSATLWIVDSEGNHLAETPLAPEQEQRSTKVTFANLPKKEQILETKSNKESQLQKERDWLQNNPYINPELNTMRERYQKEQLERKEILAQEDQAQKDLEAQKRHNEMLKRRDSGTTSTVYPIKKLNPVKSANVSNLETVSKSGVNYKIDPITNKVYTAKGELITDKTFAKNISANYRPNIKQIELKTPIVESTFIIKPSNQELEDKMKEKVKSNLLAETRQPVLQDTRSQGRQVLDKTKTVIKDFFTSTDEEKEERKQRRLNRK